MAVILSRPHVFASLVHMVVWVTALLSVVEAWVAVVTTCIGTGSRVVVTVVSIGNIDAQYARMFFMAYVCVEIVQT